MPKIEKYVTEYLEVEVLVRSTNQPQTSYAVAASLSEFELKEILIDKMEENNSINRSDIQNNLYNALVESYNSHKDIITSYGDVVTLKRGRDDQDKDEDPSVGSNRGSKRKRSGKKAKSSKEPKHKESKSSNSSKDQLHQEFNTGNDDETSEREALDVDESWHNLEGKPYPHDLSKPLPLIQNENDHQVILWDYSINNDLEYLKGGSSSRKYTTSITKTKAADYGQVKWIEDKSDTKACTMTMEILLEPTSNKLLVERFDTSAGNHVKKILLKLNLPDHRSILTDLNVTLTKHGQMTKPYSSPRLIANCSNAGFLKMEVKVPDSNYLKDS
nr:hypothetical protein [Tanacetum cinerariifolium]